MIYAADFYKELVQRTKGGSKETYGDTPVWTAQMKLLITQVIKAVAPDTEIRVRYRDRSMRFQERATVSAHP